MEAKKIYAGIDFGACNLKAAYLQGKKVRTIKLNKKQDAGVQTPNLIYYSQQDHCIGLMAKKKGQTDPKNLISHIKTQLEQADWQQLVPNLGKKVNALRVVTDIFAKLWQEMVRLQDDKAVWDITLTAPVAFSLQQKKILFQAATEAGLPVKQIISEPFAAVLSQQDLLEEAEEAELGLIFDFGGSTLDISLLEIAPDTEGTAVRELAATGLKYGGLDIDQAIYEAILKKKYPQEIAQIIQSGVSEKEILEQIAIHKEEMFAEDEAEETLMLTSKDGKMYELSFTQAEVLQALTQSGIGERICRALEWVLEEADRPLAWIRTFGGTSYIPYFRQLLTAYADDADFDPEDELDEEVYTAVAEGAARYGAICAGEETKISAQNIIPYAIGLVSQGVFKSLIRRNVLPGFVTPYQTWLAEYLTALDYKVPLYQQFLADDAEDQAPVYIGTLVLTRKHYPQGEPVLYKMKIDQQEHIQVQTFLAKGEWEPITAVETVMISIGE